MTDELEWLQGKIIDYQLWKMNLIVDNAHGDCDSLEVDQSDGPVLVRPIENIRE